MNIALVAHDARKQELVEWCTHNAQALSRHTLYGTGTTARLLGEIPVYNVPSEEGVAVMDWYTMPLRVVPLLSGPLGGDQQIGAMIAEGKIDCLIFFCDNLITQGHQQDVMALVRLASLYNIAFATNRSTADHIITSPLFGNKEYKRIIPGAIENYRTRKLENEKCNISAGCDKGISMESDTCRNKECDNGEHGIDHTDCCGEGQCSGSDEDQGVLDETGV